jgi:DNA-binding beta-propeller fold protein YncE/tRNA A-37 threonylcarbamoyl transferase component Bud32
MNDGGATPTEPAGQGGDGTLAPGAEFAGLTVEAEVGRGGMGVVYRVRDRALDRVRALKVLSPERSGQAAFRERFQRESRQAAAIEHPAVTTVFAAGESAGRLYLVMRFVDGPSLSELLAERGSLPLDEVIGIVGQVAGALDAAHAAGLVHRDVKPGNVLLEGTAPDWRAFLCDFGISKLAEDASRLTSTGQFVGTVDYVAPEQIEGEAVDARSDVYSLACVAYHALSGEPPFRRDSQIATMFAHANAERPELAAPGVPPAIGRALARAMSVRPGERHASAGELTAELERLAGDAARATTSNLRRPPRPLRSHRVPLTVAALLAGAAAVAALVLALGGDGGGDGAADVEVAGAVEVPPRPLSVTAGPGRVWVASPASGTISSIVPGDDSTEREISVGGEPSAVAVGLDWLWAVDRARNELLRVDPSTGEVDQRLPVGAEPSDVVVSESDVWVANLAGDSVTRVDPGTDSQGDGREGDDPASVADEAIRVGDEPIALAVGDGVVWVVNRGADAVSVIETDGSRRDGNPIGVGQVPNDVAVGEGAVWVTDDFAGQVTPIDPVSREAGEPIDVGAHPRGVAVGLGYVWVVNGEDGTLARIDPQDRELVDDPVPVGAKPADVAVGADAVWTANYGDNEVTELRLAAGRRGDP